MKTINELGISPWPWNVTEQAGVVDKYGAVISGQYGPYNWANARLIAAAPELYEALFDCCEEVNGHDAPRCYGCRRGTDGHCMAKDACMIYKALAKASGESEARHD